MFRLLAIALLVCTPVLARDSVAIWLGSTSENTEVERFQQQWQQQNGQSLLISTMMVAADAPVALPPQAWFVISADDTADRQMLDNSFRGVVISLRAERARVLNDIQPANRPRWTGIYADPSPQQLMNVSATLFPQYRNIGVVFDRRYVSTKTEWLAAAQRQQKQLQGLYLHEGELIERMLNMILPRCDVLLLNAHSALYSPANIDHVVLQAVRQGKTVIAGGEMALKSGALLNIVPDNDARMAQAVNLTLRALRDANVGFQDATHYQLMINQQVMRTLNIALDTQKLSQRVNFSLTLPQDDSE